MIMKFYQANPGTWHSDPKKWHGKNNNDIVPMPDGFDIHNASNEPCDMASGPCSCGAWHSRADWVSRKANQYGQGYRASERGVFAKLVEVVDESERAMPSQLSH
jgi:hypothetical protein